MASLTAAEVQKLYKDCRDRFGDFPSPEADPSADQLASLKQVVASGSAPYADFSLFGPHGLRLFRKQTFTAYQLNVATGEWTKREQPGPASYHAWVEAWKVLRTLLLLLEVADSERLDAYSEHIRGYVTQFGDQAWWLIYRAECRLRSEHMERLRRILHEKPEYGHTQARSWNAVFAAAIRDSEFWTRELITPAMLWLSQQQSSASQGQGGGNASTGGSPSKRARPAEEREDKKKGKKQKKYEGEDLSEKKGDTFVLNRRGARICEGYNRGKCGSLTRSPFC